MKMKVIVYILLFSIYTAKAGNLPAIRMLSDRLSTELAQSLDRDLPNSLIIKKEKVETPLVFEWKECPSGSGEIYRELKAMPSQTKFDVLLLNCGWRDIQQSGNHPDTTAYKKNLERILREARQKKMEVLWFSTPFSGKKELDSTIQKLNGIAEKVMEKARICTIDFYQYWEQQSKRSNHSQGSSGFKADSLQSLYLSESFAQWWTASARSNRSIKRIKLWKGIPPAYEYQGNEGINSFARVENVSLPELELFYPRKRKAATAIIFFPGGGYKFLGFLRNARELAEILDPYGIAVIGLKYRTGRTPDVPLQDAKRAIRLVKAHAKEWGLNPDCIGVAGQSAGAHLALNLTSNLDEGNRQSTDKVERENCRPAFVAVFSSWNFLSMNSPFVFNAGTPPFFVRHAKDDSSFQLVCEIVRQLKKERVPTDVLFLETGGHGAFEISEQNTGRNWPMDFVQWLTKMNFYKK